MTFLEIVFDCSLIFVKKIFGGATPPASFVFYYFVWWRNLFEEEKIEPVYHRDLYAVYQSVEIEKLNNSLASSSLFSLLFLRSPFSTSEFSTQKRIGQFIVYMIAPLSASICHQNCWTLMFWRTQGTTITYNNTLRV
jgi:hypothetical protein